MDRHESPGEVTALLERAGVSKSVAPLLARGGEILRRLAAVSAEGTEFGAVLDASTGRSLGEYVKGANHEVDLNPLMAMAAPGQRFVAVHTHPAGSSFSLADVRFFLNYPVLDLLAAVAGDGRWYVVSDLPGARRAGDEIAAQRYSRAVDDLRDPLIERIARSEIGAQQALILLEDAVWRSIAPALGLRYDRSR